MNKYLSKPGEDSESSVLHWTEPGEALAGTKRPFSYTVDRSQVTGLGLGEYGTRNFDLEHPTH